MCRNMGISVSVCAGIYFGDAPGSRILRAATTWDLQVASGLKQENKKTSKPQKKKINYIPIKKS